MSVTKIPGVTFLHRFITPECRLRGKEDVIFEVLKDVEEKLNKAYDYGDIPIIHTVITIEYPEVKKDERTTRRTNSIEWIF